MIHTSNEHWLKRHALSESHSKVSLICELWISNNWKASLRVSSSNVLVKIHSTMSSFLYINMTHQFVFATRWPSLFTSGPSWTLSSVNRCVKFQALHGCGARADKYAIWLLIHVHGHGHADNVILECKRCFAWVVPCLGHGPKSVVLAWLDFYRLTSS